MTISKAAERKQLLDRMDVLEQRLEQQENFGELIGNTAGMREVYRLALGVAPTSATVLVLGESGTGKELIARAIHQHSNRTDRPFLAVNCSAIPVDLVESELFGHTRGAFTGADRSTLGFFRAESRLPLSKVLVPTMDDIRYLVSITERGLSRLRSAIV
jgi:transcriptional regulator with GAF, ATPase, and Fis domain